MAKGSISAIGYETTLNSWVSCLTHWGAYKSARGIVIRLAGEYPCNYQKEKDGVVSIQL